MTGLRRRVLFRLATSGSFERGVRVLPSGRVWAIRRARRYVCRTRRDALDTAADLRRAGVEASIDYFGERVADVAEAARVVDEFVALARIVAGRPGVHVSVDLSHVGLDRGPEACLQRLARVCEALPPGHLVQVGAEEAWRGPATRRVLLAGADQGLPLMATIQANLRTAGEDLRTFVDAGVPVRLVEGAYVEDPAIAWPWGRETDDAYVELATAATTAVQPSPWPPTIPSSATAPTTGRALWRC